MHVRNTQHFSNQFEFYNRSYNIVLWILFIDFWLMGSLVLS